MTIYQQIEAEIERAREKFPPFHSLHEAYGTIKEEFDEFWDCVKANEPGWEDELIQVAAMCVAAIRERGQG